MATPETSDQFEALLIRVRDHAEAVAARLWARQSSAEDEQDKAKLSDARAVWHSIRDCARDALVGIPAKSRNDARGSRTGRWLAQGRTDRRSGGLMVARMEDQASRDR